MNPKSFVNIVFKRNSQKPNPVILDMLHYGSLEVLFRLSMMFLKRNKDLILEGIKANTKGGDEGNLKRHQTKIDYLMKKFYPKDSNPLKEFAELERWVGHDLLVTAIMTGAKTSGNKNLFAKGIPDIQWEEFKATEVAKKSEKPDRNLIFVPAEKPKVKAVRDKQKSKNPAKQGITEGKHFGIL
jgi:hypothetical protein